ncbi:MAG TPA: hypothetical protein VL986_09795 [Terracidiphilus sp.]|nr:hypothetical protein [Terracidiphilus sp.]
MDIVDIPDQIAKAFKYSLRSPGAFALSLVTAISVFAVAYDLLYAFAFARIYNVKDPHYGLGYFVGLALVSLAFPLTIGARAYMRERARARPFGPHEIGIAIAPFDVISVDPETLGTASTLQALDAVSTQFFRVVQSTLSEFPEAQELKFRFLPQYTRIGNKQSALQHLGKLRATLVVWGTITQRSKQPLEIRMEMQAAVHTYTFSELSIEKFPMLPLQYFTFFEAAKAAMDRGDAEDARKLFMQARPLGAELDKNHPGMGCVETVDELLGALATGGRQQQQGAPLEPGTTRS